MQITFINNIGSGFAGHIEMEEGTTIKTLFGQQMRGRPEDYLIRVNRQHVASDYTLQVNDRVSITPIKIEGAHL